ncbi:MAG: hypothetical protein IOB85_04915 [Methylobacterium sp.]|nr:hypothetical protein [Methylobacterium sp.]MCA3677731.1 hypothetical protein [Methylobacterium sp.]MCA3680279.1 hypothetical protein [Methylobacterium sp.]MCA3683486.1 hypothetical protein [Methylobacterium sp.]MCA3686969.1 hypothetical protein [Methylobacterium sp.]
MMISVHRTNSGSNLLQPTGQTKKSEFQHFLLLASPVSSVRNADAAPAHDR